ncbi:hypothetical protein WJX72_006550 [[Myrmecia] bisecta]|uniref:VWFA domain-containing protein n=1 Tax=[Myrmecia] bisecta TaxID=41462 RepID=A0AAW1R7F2_9CHLO
MPPGRVTELTIKPPAAPAAEYPCNAKAFYLGSRIDIYDLNAAADQTNYPHSLGRDSTIICLKPRRKKSVSEAETPTGLPMETYLVAYRYGSVVIFNGAGKEAHILDMVRRHTQSPVGKEFSEEFKIVIQPNLASSSMTWPDKIALQLLSFDNIKTISHVLGQSVALDYYARKSEAMLNVFCEMNQEMQRSGNFANVGKKDLLKLVAENNVIATDIISKLGVNERFDLAWKNAEYHTIYQHLRDELEMVDRFDNMNSKLQLLQLVQANFQYFLEIMQNKKSDTLEWTIIVLIAAEICISCYEIYTGWRVLMMWPSGGAELATENNQGALACGQEPCPPQTPKKTDKKTPAPCFILDLPEELVDGFLQHLSVTDLCAVVQVCKKLKQLTEDNRRWKILFLQRWGPLTAIHERAAKLANGWGNLFRSKHLAETQAAPWQRPSPFEIQASLGRIAKPVEDSSDLSVIFAVDGSGSVTLEDFTNMTQFIAQATTFFVKEHPESKVGVIQFSNDVRVELMPQKIDLDSFNTLMAQLTRMNGGTNIAASIQAAGQLMKAMPANASRVIVLLTDGRVDPFQGREAMEIAERLADEQANVSLFAFGVGRGVEKTELERIIGVCGGASACDTHYMPLCTRDDAPW